MKGNAVTRIAFILVFLATVGGCSNSSPMPAPSNNSESLSGDQKAPIGRETETPRMEQQSLDTDTLADILGVKAWTYRYRGGPVKCWLEIVEVGQATMAERIPQHDTLESSDSEGKIVFSIRPLGGGGGELLLTCGDRESKHQMTNKEFTYHWSGSQTSHTPLNSDRVVELVAGKESELASFTAREVVFDSDEKRREVTLTLKATVKSPTEQPETADEKSQANYD